MDEKVMAENLIRLLKGEKSATGTPTSYYAHGPTGIFAVAGADARVISTVVHPEGIGNVMPAFPSRFMYPLYPYLTGFQADSGSEPSTACADCVVAGIKKACYQTAVFGRYCRETKEFNVNTIGQMRDRLEPTDLRLLNPVGPDLKLVPAVTKQDPLANEIAQAMTEVGISFERLLAQQIWQGNPANNVGTGYVEFPGLEILVGTGKVDALSQTSCPSLDSDVKDFNYGDVCTATTPGIVEALTYLYRYCAKNARTMNLDPVDFRWAMREELFYELTSCWPCSYISFRCGVTDTAQIDVQPQLNANDAITMRDSMREGRYLLVDGKRIPVILDDGITEETDADSANLNAGEFASDIFLLPFSVKGNVASLYMEFFDYQPGYAQLQSGPGDMFSKDFFSSDGGMFSWTKSRINWCFLWLAETRPRIRLATPQLAGRLQNVKYVPLQHTRQPFPDDGYFVDGGLTTRSAPSYYNEWD